ncbi:uncharacterized protein LOC126988669 [Eriocheir sinensis]|uniref:uncharacterized protein LOC126988669 n=1 Tax=Eriocheir sinensis TaxID=95602 RepID=UPI0021C79165|nr:uncharacterized protein LOC126988669 [Eriocheir sinensis]
MYPRPGPLTTYPPPTMYHRPGPLTTYPPPTMYPRPGPLTTYPPPTMYPRPGPLTTYPPPTMYLRPGPLTTYPPLTMYHRPGPLTTYPPPTMYPRPGPSRPTHPDHVPPIRTTPPTRISPRPDHPPIRKPPIRISGTSADAPGDTKAPYGESSRPGEKMGRPSTDCRGVEKVKLVLNAPAGVTSVLISIPSALEPVPKDLLAFRKVSLLPLPLDEQHNDSLQ